MFVTLNVGKGFRNKDNNVLARFLQMFYTTYLKVERDQHELSLLMALRICAFYKLDLHEFVAMFSDVELGRKELSIVKAHEKNSKKKGRTLKSKSH